MKVHELMNPKVITVGPKAPLREILQLMLRYHLNNIVVVDSDQRLEGIVTYSDLSRKLLPTQQELMEHEEYLTTPQLMEDRFKDFARVPVGEIMTRNVITVSPDVEALKAGATMTARRVKQLPVIQNHKVMGIISHTDIGWGLIMQYPS
jgi:CBS domain-containing protein